MHYNICVAAGIHQDQLEIVRSLEICIQYYYFLSNLCSLVYHWKISQRRFRDMIEMNL